LRGGAERGDQAVSPCSSSTVITVPTRTTNRGSGFYLIEYAVHGNASATFVSPDAGPVVANFTF
jgi:hypothetical protein